MTAPIGPFATRHIGPRDADQEKMLAACGFGSMEDLLAAAVPASIRTAEGPNLPPALSEPEALAELRRLADRNRPLVQMIGLGYYDTHTPGVIRRNVLENPAWYTAYTAYQPEISQGRLEALMNFQTVISDLTGLPVAGASLLDEGTAAAEAMTLVRRTTRKVSSPRFLVDAQVLPQTLAVLRTRAEPLGIELEVVDLDQPNGTAGTSSLGDQEFFGILVQYPGADGAVRDFEPLVSAAHERGAQVVMAADLLALTMLRSPGELGADVAVGSAQRFGVPLMYGGPHAGYISCRQGLERSLPGRLVGASVDVAGQPAYRFALQTREQHIRREKATSNICTAQVLLAVLAGMYAVYHGPEGLRAIAGTVHRHARTIAARLRAAGIQLASDNFFDTIQAVVPGRADEVVAVARERGVNLRLLDADRVGVACDETTTATVVDTVCEAFGVANDVEVDQDISIGTGLLRTTGYLTHPVFHRHRSETAMLRYLRGLADDDYALDRGMIPLGSCTMKLNPTTAMESITWPEFAGIHPFAPAEDADGYLRLIDQLQDWLARITGYAAVSVQPNAGSVGELAGLLAIRAYHRSNGQPERDVCLIPSSAHGTNAASAVMAGLRVVVVSSAEDGTVDLDDLRGKLEQHGDRLAAIMVTYPSTHGVYEQGIGELCDLVHQAGGQVYVDGANLNALVGLAEPGSFGGDVSHLNLHKTFCIPHGGGGPGVGPIGVREHLVPFLPGHPMHPTVQGDAGTERTAVGPVAAAPFGSAGILPISWAYIAMMGEAGLSEATRTAVLAANYIANRLAPHYPVLYTGERGLVAHECIIDLRPLTKQTGVTVDDVAKRLVDYGFHAPTMSFPVAGTFMVEPTESEDMAELDRFCDAMIAIRQEAEKVGDGEWPAEDNPLHNAPHTIAMLAGEWNHPYSREQAAYPVATLRRRKYWAPVRRIDQAYGDRNLVCTCPSPEAFAET